MFIDNVVEVAKRELSWEVDYVRERECTLKFKELLKPYPEYKVPDVVGMYSYIFHPHHERFVTNAVKFSNRTNFCGLSNIWTTSILNQKYLDKFGKYALAKTP